MHNRLHNLIIKVLNIKNQTLDHLYRQVLELIMIAYINKCIKYYYQLSLRTLRHFQKLSK